MPSRQIPKGSARKVKGLPVGIQSIAKPSRPPAATTAPIGARTRPSRQISRRNILVRCAGVDRDHRNSLGRQGSDTYTTPRAVRTLSIEAAAHLAPRALEPRGKVDAAAVGVRPGQEP